jgi:hypothetical protein
MDLPRLVARLGDTARQLCDRVESGVAQRRELRKLRAIGRSLAVERGETAHLAALEVECARSLELDRADEAQVALWMLPVVCLRGLAARAVLRHRVARGHRALRARYEELGRAALGGSSAGGDPSAVARERSAPEGRARAEAARFGEAFWKQLRPAILPRAPALAGLAAGWWIANTYTDSRWKSLARSIGIGSGGTTLVSGDTYRAMHFWLPLLAAAVCAYLGDRIAAAWKEH